MKPFLFLLFVFLFSPLSLAETKACGSSELDIHKTGEWESTRFIITVINGNDDMKLVLKSVDYVSQYCEKDIKGQNKILILAICGGSGCSESTYIVIDARTLMVELVPFRGQGNLEQVEEILGHEIKR